MSCIIFLFLEKYYMVINEHFTIIIYKNKIKIMSTKIANVSNINTENYEDFLKNKGIIVIDILASWCAPCKILSPIIDTLAAEFLEEGADIRVGKMDADSNRDKVIDLGVTSIPTILIYKDGELLDRHTGAIPKNKLKEMIKKHI